MNPPASPRTPALETRRRFLQKSALASAALASAKLVSFGAVGTPPPAATGAGDPALAKLPWYRRAVRWGQTNIAELDITRYDIPWWREQWKRTAVQGLVINAGGIVAYYPTQIPYHHRSEYLGDRDLFGDLTKAAHADGIAVFARMDSNGADAECYRAHPDWFCVNAAGRPEQSRGLYVPCVNGPYYREHIPAILREIIQLYHPEGFTDNSWSGLPRTSFCFCANCQRLFAAYQGGTIPTAVNWNDANYRNWIVWNYANRLEIWDLYNKVTQDAGGPDCIWIGMNGGSVTSESGDFRDVKEICRRAPMLMLDDQRRDNATGFQRNGEVGKLIHCVLGWDKVAPESMALYMAGAPQFRHTAKPEPEVRLWMIEGFAGGIQPWWHQIGAYVDDRRAYHTAEPLMQWQKTNEQFLGNRQPIASAAVLWTQRNTDFFGRNNPELAVDLPARGFMQALVRARIPYLPVHADYFERDDALYKFKVVVLPNLGAMSDDQVAAVRRFVQRGGGLVATGASSLCDEWGDPRADFALADLFGAHLAGANGLANEANRSRWASQTDHSYLRLFPEWRAKMFGPHAAGEPPATGERHPVLRGFEETDILAYGGNLEALRVDPSAKVLLTYVPPYPTQPPEFVYTTTPNTDIPGLIVNEPAGGGRVAYLPADIDRRYARDNFPDQGMLLANLVRWTAQDQVPLTVEGPGWIDCHYYQQPGRAILHLVNLTNTNAWRAPVDELIPVGPIRVRLRLPEGVPARNLRLLVNTDHSPVLTADNGWVRFELPSILDHEVVVIG